MMLLLLFVTVFGGALACPSDVNALQRRLFTCIMPLRVVEMSNDPDAQCQAISEVVQCFQTLEEECGDNEEVQVALQMINVAQLADMCKPGEGGCPSMAALGQSVHACFNGVSEPDGTPNCSAMRKGMQCMAELERKCADDPTFQMMVQEGALSELQSSFTAACGGSTGGQMQIPA